MTNWIQTLAETDKERKNSNARGTQSHQLKQFVEKETRQYMGDLKAAFASIVQEFNTNKIDDNSSIKLYNIEGAKSSFMLFRGVTQLNIRYSKPGQIKIDIQNIQAYQNTTKSLLSIQLNMSLGNFEEVIWIFNKRPVDMNSLLKYLVKMLVHISC
ncbi:MAG: hypothetical protein HAW63_02340 [Bdellovibrionaceae bacterium]|nr:hypothetical protein [Pseudobdellovibrionaceae bacterium]